MIADGDAFDAAFDLVMRELRNAESKWPGWPTDPVHGAAVVAEESGELVQAALDFTYSNGGIGPIQLEAAQVAAMGIRMLVNLAKCSMRKSERL